MKYGRDIADNGWMDGRDIAASIKVMLQVQQSSCYHSSGWQCAIMQVKKRSKRNLCICLALYCEI